MTDPAIPSAADAIGQGVNALVAARPAALLHVDGGRYGNVFAGWKAQEQVLIARVADEVRSSRLPTSVGDALRQLVASEFDIQTGSDGRAKSVGTFQFTNPGVNGTIPRGTRIRRLPNINLSPPVREAVFGVTEDVYVSTALGGTFTVPVQCSTDGSIGNVSPDDGTFAALPLNQQYQVVDQLFAPNLGAVITAVDIGGGAEVTTDDDLRRASRAMAQGRYAPVRAALLAFALRGYGVRRAWVFEDPVAAVARVVVADGNRHGSAYWSGQIKRALYDAQAVGFGARISVDHAILTWVNVAATITLRDAAYGTYTTDISNNVRAALSNYFGQRDDWWSLKVAAIRGVIGRADPRILTCATATVTTATGAPQVDTVPYTPGPGATPPQSFWTLASQGFQPTYVNPS